MTKPDGDSRRALIPIFAQLDPGDLVAMNLVRSVGQAQKPGGRICGG
jgi:hypothetical protein